MNSWYWKYQYANFVVINEIIHEFETEALVIINWVINNVLL